MRRLTTTALLACAVHGLAACANNPEHGYTLAPAYRTDIQTIAVPIFDMADFAPGLELELTEAVVKEIHRTTPWKVVARGQADTILTGVITDASLRKLSTDRDTGLVQEMAYALTASFEWKDRTTGRVLVSRRNFRAAEPYVPARPAQERVDTGQRGAIEELARAIVAELRSSW
ncbi:MAG: hypothetical protein KDA20_08900 [Phycisphaerales bacterium]|nr:hypothetical protein [Phycisphaerales bacterium]